ncbi:MAG: endolytic transglycosylase MltG [Robiginitomaculum sp.]|nr:endolytic transglycosylase MltG [Robiginitomaculum sp.]
MKDRQKSPKVSFRKILLRAFLVLIIIITLFLASGLYVYDRVLPVKFAEAGPLETEIIFVVKPGAGVNSIAAELVKVGAIEHEILFRLKGRLSHDAGGLKAGEYSIDANASIDQIFEKLQKAKVIQYAVTIAEGLTVRAIIRQLQQYEFLTGDITVIPPEGSLHPETWHVIRGTDRQDMLRRMQTSQSKILAELWKDRDPDLPFSTPAQALILASIVERETGVSMERERVAAVFVNRLRKGMRLDSDPTIIYGLNGGEPLGRGLRRSEIDRKTAWNTYHIRGLPPTPISNPGRAAIWATLHPAKTRDLYFVADGTGGHVFAKTYAGHLVNVAKWRRIERKRKREAKANRE